MANSIRVWLLAALVITPWVGCHRVSDSLPGQPPVSFEDGGLRVEVTTPRGVRNGVTEFRLHIRDSKGASVDDARVSVQYGMAMAGSQQMGGRALAKPMGDGEYLAETKLDMAGTWQVAISAERPSGEVARAQGSMRTGAGGMSLSGQSGEPAQGEERRGGEAISHYTCSMHPSVHETHPGQCPICGMDLVPVTESQAKTGTVRVDPQRLQKIGVRFAEVRRAPLTRIVRALGRVTWDETKLVDFSLKVRGFVQNLRADSLGAKVTKGETLFSVYSPELFAAQTEYLQSLEGRSDSLRTASRARLRLWDIADRDIETLEKRRAVLETLPVRAPASGFIVEKNVVEGGAFEPGMKLFRIAPLERVWVEAEVYASDLGLISVGQAATIHAPYLPTQSLAGRVAYVLPALASESRTARIRLEIENSDLALRPEMFVDVELHADLGERLVVPVSAVIVDGERRVVFVDRGAGVLEPRAIHTGLSNADQVEVLDGLEPGERVVASGNFLIAAESRVQSALEQW